MLHVGQLLVVSTLVLGCASGTTQSGPASTAEAGSSAEVSAPAPRQSTDLRDVTFTTVGGLALGMTQDEAREVYPDLQVDELSGGCSQWYAGGADPMNAAYALTVPSSGERILGIIAPTTGTTTDRGVGIGSRFSDVRAAYGDREIEEAESQVGQVLLVRGDTSWLRFSAPSAEASIEAVAIGDHDYAAGYELCSDE
jgi:hypothetical protein